MYLNILIETAHTASIIPFGSDTTLYAMKAFGGYNMPLAVLFAVIGATAGQAFNWFAGKLLFKLPAKRTPQFDAYYAKAQTLFQKYGIFLLLFSWVALFKLLVVASGFLGVRLKTALPLIAAGVAVHYGLALI